MSNSVIVSGWLRKSPPEKKLRKNAWRKRWFVLSSGRLSGEPNLLQYYKHEGTKKPIGAISLDQCLQIDANVPVKYDRKDHSQQFVFDIVTKNRTYYLVASSRQEMTFWVRYLCDLCGFNHDNPNDQSDLGSQQQTFKAAQPMAARNQNGTSPLLDDEQETPLSTDAPAPLPRPATTMTKRSILIRSRGQNGHVDQEETSATDSNPAAADAPGLSHQVSTHERDGYAFASDATSAQSSSVAPLASSNAPLAGSSEYLLLTDFATAQTSGKQENPASLPTDNLGDRRPSTDSVFTREGAASDTGSDVIVDQPVRATPLQYAGSNMRKKRLDSMPDCPPPPPPVQAHNEQHPKIGKIDERGYAYPPDDIMDGDRVTEARKRSVPTAGLSPIDDSEINRVPLNLQREYGVDEMGRPIQGSTSTNSSRHDTYNTSGYCTSEYINTAEASAEAKFGNFTPTHRHDAMQFPIVGAPFASPNNKSAASQITNSSVFFNSSGPNDGTFLRPPIYDTPSSLAPMYVSPRATSPHHSSIKGGLLYSSASALSPYGSHGSPVRMGSPQISPHLVTRLRRSSSVGQLESVANELATQSSRHDSPTRQRRSSIHNGSDKKPLVHPSPYGQPVPMDHLAAAPPPRPPKSDVVAQPYHEPPRDYYNFDDKSSTEYFNLSVSHTGSSIKQDPPPSPPHTEVITVSLEDGEESLLSPAHTAIIGTVTKNGERYHPTNNDMSRIGSASSSGSSGCSSSTCSTGPSSGRSSAAVYDLTARDPHPVPLYDTPRKDPVHNNDLYDTPKPTGTPVLCDTPSKSLALADIDENKCDYETMQDQLADDDDAQPLYASMAGATSMVNSPPFVNKAMSPLVGRSSAFSEPPPVQRDLKPGRRSLGSDGGIADVNKHHHARGSYDDPTYDNMTSHPHPDPPISPPHVTLMHTMASTPGIDSNVDVFSMRAMDRTLPPERPPKNMTSPRTPPSAPLSSHVPGRPPPYGYDRSRYGHDAQGPGYPARKTRGGGPAVPGRPPKPPNIKPGSSPNPAFRDDVGFLMRVPSFGRSKGYTMSSGSVFKPDYGHNFSVSSSTLVPPPPSDPLEKKTTYVVLADLPTSGGDRAALDGPALPERAPKGDDAVEYCVLDQKKTEALQKMKVEREKKQLQRGSVESRSMKGKT